MSLIAQYFQAIGKVAGPITVSSNWGTNTVAYPLGPVSAARTLTVPAGNPGNLLLNFIDGGTGLPKYSKNGGTAAPFADGTPLTVANGDTLAFTYTPLVGTDTANITVTDTLKSVTVGTWTGNVT